MILRFYFPSIGVFNSFKVFIFPVSIGTSVSAYYHFGRDRFGNPEFGNGEIAP